MAKQIEGVYEKVIACAKKEFLEKGFVDASLRTIAQEAGTSTGSIYTRFGDKEGLFRQIVEPAAEGMRRMFLEIQETFHHFEEKEQRAKMGAYTSKGMYGLLDFMYEHFDEFRLLLDASYGTLYQNYVNELVDIEVEYTYKYMDVIGCESVRSGLVTEEFVHMVVTSYMNGIFEVIRHGMDRNTAKKYARMLNAYHMAGFKTIFSPETETKSG